MLDSDDAGMRTVPSANSDLETEYMWVGRSDLIWSYSGYQLILAADVLWERAAAGRAIKRETVRQFTEGIPIRALRSEEHEVYEQRALDRIALFLLGLSLENVAKNIVLQQHPELVSAQGGFQLKTHDLLDLLIRAAIDVSEEERHHVTVLCDYVEWYGCYQVPMAAAKTHSVLGAWNPQRLPDPANTWSVCRSLLERTVSKRDARVRGTAV